MAWHQTKESPWNLMGDMTCLAPQSSCLAHSVSKACSLNLGDRSLLHCQVDSGTGKARRSGCLTWTQQLPSESFLCSAVTCWLCQWPLTSFAGSCPPFPTLLGIFGQAEARKTQAHLLCHVLTLASPVPVAFPNSWSSLEMGSDFKQGRTPS